MNRFPDVGDEVQLGMDYPTRQVRGMIGEVVYVNQKLNQVEVYIAGRWEYRCSPDQLEEVTR